MPLSSVGSLTPPSAGQLPLPEESPFQLFFKKVISQYWKGMPNIGNIKAGIISILFKFPKRKKERLEGNWK